MVRASDSMSIQKNENTTPLKKPLFFICPLLASQIRSDKGNFF
jgi:hypothetical protein